MATPATYAVTWAPAFADANYSVEVSKSGTSLAGVDLSYSNKTATGCTITLKNTTLASLAIAAGVLDLIAIHN